MADFNKNIDKVCFDEFETGLYNTVLKTDFSSEGAEPVTMDEAKLWCKIDDDTTDDSLLDALITAARQICEQFSNIGFLKRTITASINNADGGFNLPYGPVVTTPTAVDVNNASLTLTYNMGQVQFPRGAMVVTYQAGYEQLPENLKTAIKQQIIFLYENRGEGTVGLSPMAQMILLPLRKI